MTKMTKAEALDLAIFALNTFEHPDASSRLDVANLDANIGKVIKKLCKMRNKARAKMFDEINMQRINTATHVLHFGVMGTDPDAGAPEFVLRVGEVVSADTTRDESVLVFPNPMAGRDDNTDIGILDRGGWPAWGEPAHDGELTFHVSIFYDHMPSPAEAEWARRMISARVNLGRVLDYACLTEKEDWSEEIGTYLFHMNENDAAYFVPEARTHD
jgi:hypothetical protein